MSPFTKNSCSAFCWKETSMAPSAFCDIKEFLLGFCHQNCQWNGFNASLNMSSVREGVSQWCSCWLAHGKQYCHFAQETGAQLSKLSKMSEWVRSFWAKISCGGCKRNDTRYHFLKQTTTTKCQTYYSDSLIFGKSPAGKLHVGAYAFF
jgi:hypothetical protein